MVQKGFFNKAVSIRPAVSSFTITGSFTRKNNWPVSLRLERGWDLPPPLSFLLPPPDDKDNQILPYGELGLNCFSICWPGCFFSLSLSSRVLKMCSDLLWWFGAHFKIKFAFSYFYSYYLEITNWSVFLFIFIFIYFTAQNYTNCIFQYLEFK